jgi:hypothetical protein
MEGIEFGPLQHHPEKIIPVAQIVHTPFRTATTQEEPIAKAAGQGLKNFAHWWNHSPMNTPLKVALLVAVAMFALFNGEWLVPAAVVLGTIYLVYLGARLVVLHRRSPATVAAPAATAHIQARSASEGLTWEQHGRLMLREKTAADHAGELTGSMLAAALVAGVLAVVMAAIGGESMDDSANPLAGPVWLWLMTMLGTWLVLGAGKCCEQKSGEMIKRRFGMLAAGLLFGAIAFASSKYLMVQISDGDFSRSLAGRGIVRGLYDTAGVPQLAAYLAYFGAVFLTIGWWKLCDPLRRTRLRIAPILVAVLVAWIWQLVIPFPQPWGFMLVAGIAIATQLSAPWLSREARTAAITRRTH